MMAEIIDILFLFFALSGLVTWVALICFCIYMWRNEMTHTEELIFRLRDTASRGVSSWGDLQQEAADHIVGQDLLIEVLKKQLSAAVAAEREACALLVEDMNSLLSPEIATAIRARGQE
jgi:hypothetical protein